LTIYKPIVIQAHSQRSKSHGFICAFFVCMIPAVSTWPWARVLLASFYCSTREPLWKLQPLRLFVAPHFASQALKSGWTQYVAWRL